jgi:hypothetical protein
MVSYARMVSTGEPLLRSRERSLQCRLEAPFHPNREIEVAAIGALEQVDSLQNDDIHIRKLVAMFAVPERCLFGEICNKEMAPFFLLMRFSLRPARCMPAFTCSLMRELFKLREARQAGSELESEPLIRAALSQRGDRGSRRKH